MAHTMSQLDFVREMMRILEHTGIATLAEDLLAEAELQPLLLFVRR